MLEETTDEVFKVYMRHSDPDNDGWIGGNRVAARKSSGSALLARMIFDKDNLANQ
jgi:hypothetical protein